MLAKIRNLWESTPDKFPLHSAVRGGKPEEVKKVLQTGVDVSLQNEKGLTAFTLALLNGLAEIEIPLLEKGAAFPSERPGRNPDPAIWSITNCDLSLLLILPYFNSEYKKTIVFSVKTVSDEIDSWNNKQPSLAISERVRNAETRAEKIRSLLQITGKFSGSTENNQDPSKKLAEQAKNYDEIANVYSCQETDEREIQSRISKYYLALAEMENHRGNTGGAKGLKRQSEHVLQQAFVDFYHKKANEYRQKSENIRKDIILIEYKKQSVGSLELPALSEDELESTDLTKLLPDANKAVCPSPVGLRHRKVVNDRTISEKLPEPQH